MGRLYNSQRQKLIERALQEAGGWITASSIRERANAMTRRLSVHTGAVSNLMLYLEKKGLVSIKRGGDVHLYKWIGE